MAKLSLSEVSKQFNVDRSTIYRAVRNGRLSRSSDGQFDIAEVIRCFGDPEPKSQRIETSKQESDDATKRLITHLEHEVRKYQEREERLMQQIDRMQTLIELKSVASATAVPHQDATTCDDSAPHYNKDDEIIENKEKNGLSDFQNVALPQQDATARYSSTLQHATSENVATSHPKKRGLFGRVLQAVLSDA